MSILVSVVIPTYRRDDLLRRCLEKLLAQSLAAELYEVIVCDDGPSDSTREAVESLAERNGPRIRYVPVVATQGPAGARNAGWQAAVGEVIAFTDDDCLPNANWLQAGWAAIEDADAVAGRTVVPLPAWPTDYELDTAGLSTAEFITANCFCRREALEAIGGFDERFTSAWREDSDLHFSLLERGRRIVRAADAVIVHPVRPAPWGACLKQQKKGAFDVLLYRKHPELYAERIPPFPCTYLVANGSLAVACACLAGGAFWLAASAAVLWLVVTLEFALRRLRRTSKSLPHVLEMLITSALIPPLSLFWRGRGIVRFRLARTAESAGRPTLTAASR